MQTVALWKVDALHVKRQTVACLHIAERHLGRGGVCNFLFLCMKTNSRGATVAVTVVINCQCTYPKCSAALSCRKEKRGNVGVNSAFVRIIKAIRVVARTWKLITTGGPVSGIRQRFHKVSQGAHGSCPHLLIDWWYIYKTAGHVPTQVMCAPPAPWPWLLTLIWNHVTTVNRSALRSVDHLSPRSIGPQFSLRQRV